MILLPLSVERGIESINKIKNSLSTKIFLGIAAILLIISLLMFGILRIFMPMTYENELTTQLTVNLQKLVIQVENTPIEQWQNILVSFCTENNARVSILDENNEQVVGFSVSIYNADDKDINSKQSDSVTSFTATFEWEGKPYSIVTYVNVATIDQMIDIFTKIFPYVFVVIIIISALTAFFYSRFLAKPVIDISNVSKRMSTLDMTWRCDIKRTDEIGILAENLNNMAVQLDNALGKLKIANEKLQADIDKEREQDKRRRDFFSAISHELKTPVTILKGQLDGMILNIGKFKDRDTYLQESYQTAESIEKLVREILILARLDTLNLKIDNISLNDLTTKCCQAIEILAQNKHIRINFWYDANITIAADKKQMNTVLSNIIGNAVKHSPENSKVDIKIDQKDDKVTFIVENTGVFINKDELSQIWEPFYRTDKSRSRDTGGSGLGLYIVKTILDLHGFNYWLENTDTGIKFSIEFPNENNK